MSLSAASLYGKGVFTTIAVRGGEPFLWEKHWRRLSANAIAVGVDLSGYNEATVAEALAETIDRDKIVNGRARLTFNDESPTAVWPGDSIRSTSLSIITAGVREKPDAFKLTVSPYHVNSRSPLAGIKSCNYLENLMAMDEAKERGFHEAVRVNEGGHITSGCISNVFWLKGERLFTPALTTGCLPGTTREFILENLGCSEVEEPLETLEDVQAIFLTSAGLGVVEAAEFDGRRLDGSGHPVNSLLGRFANVR